MFENLLSYRRTLAEQDHLRLDLGRQGVSDQCVCGFKTTGLDEVTYGALNENISHSFTGLNAWWLEDSTI